MKEYRSKLISDNLIQWIVIVSICNVRLETYAIILVLLTTQWKGLSVYLRIASLFFIHALLLTLILGYSMIKPLEQILLLGIHGVGYYTFLRSRVKSIDEIWGKYLIFCEFLGYMGIFQAICMFMIGVNPFSFVNQMSRTVDVENGFRLHAIFGEPGYLSTFLLPYIIYSISIFSKIDKKRFFVVFIVFVGAFGAGGFLVLLFYILYRLFTSKYKLPSCALAALLIFYVGLSTKGASEREDQRGLTGFFVKVEQSSNAFADMDPNSLEVLNASTYASMANLWVAINAPSRFLGTGIGTHQQSYERLYPPTSYNLYGLNKDDAYSMFTRLLSEFGIVGIIFIIYLIFKVYNKECAINMSCLFFIVSLFVRGGHYTMNGVFFFSMIYFFTSKTMYKINKYVTC